MPILTGQIHSVHAHLLCTDHIYSSKQHNSDIFNAVAMLTGYSTCIAIALCIAGPCITRLLHSFCKCKQCNSPFYVL